MTDGKRSACRNRSSSPSSTRMMSSGVLSESAGIMDTTIKEQKSRPETRAREMRVIASCVVSCRVSPGSPYLGGARGAWLTPSSFGRTCWRTRSPAAPKSPATGTALCERWTIRVVQPFLRLSPPQRKKERKKRKRGKREEKDGTNRCPSVRCRGCCGRR